ncbi:hypothetical protein H310_09463 [Aphanomyces invadans]|uniref:Calponin-homology (CH) domain-containing protein n=1 Tax=Aphanomyces invadans TaxID=157072 RepID=A0A024TTR4_9STRA|nr:hypothetical protein H310_09463 [Aphanomyces invadans]ETV97555.1 hypothetical protein H310_09463 [Aphanomyces invadans]|eukprot:XP_008873764.1 hypothetical protein H310_09463 [Aphanomyces invadans]
MESPSAAALRWIESKTKQSPPTPDTTLCEYLRDGRVLCMLANALSETNEVRVRSPDRFRTYHALESVSLFLRWARDRASIGDNVMFTSAQLIDEQDEDAVLACLRALEAKFRFQTVAVLPTADAVASSQKSSTPALTPSVVEVTVESSKSTSSTTCTAVLTLPPAEETRVNVVERIQQMHRSGVESVRTSPRRRQVPSPKQTSPPPCAPPSRVDPPPSVPSPLAPPSPRSLVNPATTACSSSPNPRPLTKSTSKLALFLSSTPATPATIIKAPPQPPSRLASLSSASDVAVEVNSIEPPPHSSTTVAPAADRSSPTNTTASAPIVATEAPLESTKLSPSPPRQRNKIASAYLAAIESNSSSAMPPTPERALSPKRLLSPVPTATWPVPPKGQAFTSPNPVHVPPSPVKVEPVATVDTAQVLGEATRGGREFEPLTTTDATTTPSAAIVVTIPSLSAGGFEFAWSRERESVVLLLHQQPMWPHWTLSSINGVLLSTHGRSSLAESRRVFRELSAPFECRFESWR